MAEVREFEVRMLLRFTCMLDGHVMRRASSRGEGSLLLLFPPPPAVAGLRNAGLSRLVSLISSLMSESLSQECGVSSELEQLPLEFESRLWIPWRLLGRFFSEDGDDDFVVSTLVQSSPLLVT